MGNPVIIGMRNLVYAVLQNDPTSGTATYGAVKLISGAISATVNPNASTATLFADDGPYDVASALGEISVELNVADIPLDVQAELLGHTKSGGILVRKASDNPPWVAIGYKSLKSNGKYRFTWLSKGKFVAPEQSNQTKGDSPEFQTPTISGNFVRRDCDDEWQRHADEDDVDYMASIGANWFTSPYGGAADVTAPTISSTTPAANASAVAVTSSVVWNFSEALALSTVNTGNFLLVKDTDGAAVTGTLAINAARTQVTFTPAANLTAATAYRAIVTTGVTDLAGNKLASSDVRKFTTA